MLVHEICNKVFLFHLQEIMISRRNLLVSAVTFSTVVHCAQVCAQPVILGNSVSEESWFDSHRQRNLPVKIRWPNETAFSGSCPIVIFSHGLGGTRNGGSIWGKAWSDAGFVVIHMQHVGSDLEAVRSVAKSFAEQSVLRRLASAEQLMARLLDVTFVLNEIERRQSIQGNPWQRTRLSKVGLAGHSFGAHTTMGMAGQRYPGFEGISEPRISAFIAFSPTIPAIGNAKNAFQKLTRPLLSITGTRDGDVLGVGATPERRIAVFAALPEGNKAHLVLKDADHMTFAGESGRATEIVPRENITRELQESHHATLAAITTDWWRSTLNGDVQASARLIEPRINAGDIWQLKN